MDANYVLEIESLLFKIDGLLEIDTVFDDEIKPNYSLPAFISCCNIFMEVMADKVLDEHNDYLGVHIDEDVYNDTIDAMADEFSEFVKKWANIDLIKNNEEDDDDDEL